MNNIDSYKEFIQDSIINRLERLMGNDGWMMSTCGRNMARKVLPT